MCGQKCHVTQIPEVAVCVLEDEQPQGNFTFQKDLGSNLEATQSAGIPPSRYQPEDAGPVRADAVRACLLYTSDAADE